ncbi:hypothetical protein CR513_33377, partial [Mucuna pruriens]
MRQMLKICESTQVTTRTATLYHLTLVILQVGCGYPRLIPNNTRTGEVPDRDGGLFHKMDRGETGCHDLGRKNQTLLLEEDNLSVRLAGQNSLRQRDTVRLPLKIKQQFTSMEHPQSNGHAEVANKVILRGLRKRLEEAKERWSYHTTPHSSTNETPFRLTFGTEAVIPVEIKESSLRTALFQPGENEEELRVNLDLLKEARKVAQIREYTIKARAAKQQSKRLSPQQFKSRTWS